MTHHLVGLTEIARMLGVSRQRASQLVANYDDFPEAEAELSMGRIWTRTSVEEWIGSHPDRRVGRPPGRADKHRRRMAKRALFTRFTSESRRVVAMAQEEARYLQHNYIGTEHLLLGIIKGEGDALGGVALRNLGVTYEGVLEHLYEMIGRGTEQPTGHIPFTPRTKKVLELSLREALSRRERYIGTEHLVLAMCREAEGVAWQIIEKFGVTQSQVREAIDAVTAEDAGSDAEPAGDVLKDLYDRIEALEKRLEERDKPDEA